MDEKAFDNLSVHADMSWGNLHPTTSQFEDADNIKVVFHDMKDDYRMDNCIKCYFEIISQGLLMEEGFLDLGHRESMLTTFIKDGDFIGLYQIGYKNLSECIASVDCKKCTVTEENHKLSVVFSVEALPKSKCDFYQFIYVRKGHVYGFSTPFILQDPADDESLVIVSEDDFLVVQSAGDKEEKKDSNAYEQKLQSILKDKVDAQFLYELQKKECEKLKKEKESLCQQMEVQVMQNGELKKKNSSLMQKVSELLDKHGVMIVQTGILKNLLDEKEKVIKASEVHMEKEKTLMDACKQQIGELASSNEKLQKTLKEKETEITSHKSDLEAEKATNQTLSTQLSEFSVQIDSLKTSLVEKDEEVASRRSTLEFQKTSVETLRSQLSDLSLANESLKKSVDKQNIDKKALNRRLSEQLSVTESLEKEVRDLQEERLHGMGLSEWPTEVTNLLQRIKDSEDMLRALDHSKQIVLKELKCKKLENEELETDNKRLAAKIKDLQTEMNELKKKLEEANEKAHALDAENESLKSQKSEELLHLEMEMERANKKAHALDAENEILKLQKSEELLHLEMKVERLESSKKSMTDEENDLRAKIRDLENDNEVLEEKYKASLEDIDKCMDKIADLRKQCEKEYNNVQRSTEENVQIHAVLENLTLELEYDAVTEKICDFERELNLFESQLLEAYERVDGFTTEYESAKMKKDELLKCEVKDKKQDPVIKLLTDAIEEFQDDLSEAKKEVEEKNEAYQHLAGEGRSLSKKKDELLKLRQSCSEINCFHSANDVATMNVASRIKDFKKELLELKEALDCLKSCMACIRAFIKACEVKETEVSAEAKVSEVSIISNMQQRLAEAADVYKKQYLEIRSLKKKLKKFQGNQKMEASDASSVSSYQKSSIAMESNEEKSGDFVYVRTSDSDTGEHVSRSNAKRSKYLRLQLPQLSQRNSHEDLQKDKELSLFENIESVGHSEPESISDQSASINEAISVPSSFVQSKEYKSSLSPFGSPTKEEMSLMNDSVVCPSCPEVLPLPNGDTLFLLQHLQEAHDEVVCPVCGMVFDTTLPPSYFKFHVENHFNEGNGAGTK